MFILQQNITIHSTIVTEPCFGENGWRSNEKFPTIFGYEKIFTWQNFPHNSAYFKAPSFSVYIRNILKYYFTIYSSWFQIFRFPFGFHSRIYTRFLFIHTAHSKKCIFLHLMRLRIFIETIYKNIATANKQIFNEAF